MPPTCHTSHVTFNISQACEENWPPLHQLEGKLSPADMAKLGTLLSKYQVIKMVLNKTVHNLYFGNCCRFEPGISGDKIGDRCILNLKPHVVVFTDRNVPAQFSIHTSTLFSVLDKTSIFLDLNSQRHVFPQKSYQYFLFQVWD